MASLLLVLTFLLFSSTVIDGYSIPMNDVIIKKLPGQPEVKAMQFAGYIDVQRSEPGVSRSLFYYLVEATEDPFKLPLTIWLAGEPGCSSVGEAFSSVGPFTIAADGRCLKENPFSWIKDSNLLFIDSPIGSGWSYSNRSSDYNNTDYSTTDYLVSFMIQWYEKYPRYKSRDIYLAGSGYAGHFVPNLANYLLNLAYKGYVFNIKGLALGNPLLRRKLDHLARYDFLLSRKLIRNETHRQIMEECNGIGNNTINEDNYENYMKFGNYTKIFGVNWTQIKCGYVKTKALSEAFNTTEKRISHLKLFDVLRQPCSGTLQDLKLGNKVTKIYHGVEMCRPVRANFYFNLPEVQKAFHGNRTSLPYQWKGCCMSNFKYNEYDKDTDMLFALKGLLQRSIPITIFSGEEDGIVPAMGTHKHLKKLAQDMNFTLAKDKAWRGGWMYSYENLLTFLTVKGANHEVTASRPSDALYIFRKFVLKCNKGMQYGY